jgi:hypothetical protein
MLMALAKSFSFHLFQMFSIVEPLQTKKSTMLFQNRSASLFNRLLNNAMSISIQNYQAM